MKYEIINLEDSNKSLLDLELSELECKHIINVKSPIKEEIFKLAENVGYKWVILGSHRKTDIVEEEDRIKSMLSLKERPIKIIITSDGKIWADNTHWTMAYILKYGKKVKLKDIPFYVVDFQKDKIKVLDYKNSVIREYGEIEKAINAANEIEKMAKNGLRTKNVSWKINDLMDDIYVK